MRKALEERTAIEMEPVALAIAEKLDNELLDKIKARPACRSTRPTSRPSSRRARLIYERVRQRGAGRPEADRPRSLSLGKTGS